MIRLLARKAGEREKKKTRQQQKKLGNIEVKV
jgi:hypothetical protein